MKLTNQNVFFSVIFLIMTSLACSSLSTPPTSTAVPTNTSVPTLISVDSGLAGQELLEEKLYTHPSQAVSFNPPKGWTIKDTNFDVYIHSPESVFFYVAVTNTGHQLDKDSFANYVAATENNYYTFEDNYKETDREVNQDINLILIEKTYTYQGKETFARSVYQQFGQSVYVIEMIGDNSEITASSKYDLIFTAFFKSVNADSAIASTLPVYEARWTFHSPSGAYGIDVPIGWAYKNYDLSGTNKTQDELASPDGDALIEVFSLDDNSTPSNLSYLHDFTLQVLNSTYGNNDIKILDQGAQNGNQLLEWTSAAKGTNGYAYIGTNKNTTEAFLFIILWGKDFEDVYRQTAIDILGTFSNN